MWIEKPKLNKEMPLVSTAGDRENPDHSHRLVGGETRQQGWKRGRRLLEMQICTCHKIQ